MGGGHSCIPYMHIVTLANNHPTAELNTSFAAWVNPNSIRSGQQQDELIANGFVQLNATVRLGPGLHERVAWWAWCSGRTVVHALSPDEIEKAQKRYRGMRPGATREQDWAAWFDALRASRLEPNLTETEMRWLDPRSSFRYE